MYRIKILPNKTITKPINSLIFSIKNKKPFTKTSISTKLTTIKTLITSTKSIRELEIKLNDDYLNKNHGFCSIIEENDEVDKGVKHRLFSKDLMEITKFRLSVLNTLVATSTYFFFANVPFSHFFYFFCGTLSISMATQVLNQLIERKHDQTMRRTQNRPLTKERFSNSQGYYFSGLLIGSSFIFYSYIQYGIGAFLFSQIILYSYINLYTPFKRINNMSMHVGAVVGALPSLLGSIAAVNSFPLDSFLLGAYIFCWQYPHFYGILYPNRNDYINAGFKFLAADKKKDIIAYIHMLLGMFGMILCVIWLNKRGVMNDFFFVLYLIFYIFKFHSVLCFLQDPITNGKIIRIRSYLPFVIVLLSFYDKPMRRIYKKVVDEIYSK